MSTVFIPIETEIGVFFLVVFGKLIKSAFQATADISRTMLTPNQRNKKARLTNDRTTYHHIYMPNRHVTKH